MPPEPASTICRTGVSRLVRNHFHLAGYYVCGHREDSIQWKRVYSKLLAHEQFLTVCNSVQIGFLFDYFTSAWKMVLIRMGSKINLMQLERSYCFTTT